MDREPPHRRRAGADPDVAGALIVLLDGETGKETRRISAPGTTVRGLAFSPDGKTLAATCGRARGQVRLYAVATGRLVRSFATPPISGPVVAFSPDGAAGHRHGRHVGPALGPAAGALMPNKSRELHPERLEFEPVAEAGKMDPADNHGLRDAERG